jgi:hypothetical protein
VRNLTEAEPRPHAAPPRCDGWWTRRDDPLLTTLRCASRPCRSSGSLPAPTTWPPRKPDHAPLGPDPARQRDRAGQPALSRPCNELRRGTRSVSSWSPRCAGKTCCSRSPAAGIGPPLEPQIPRPAPV